MLQLSGHVPPGQGGCRGGWGIGGYYPLVPSGGVKGDYCFFVLKVPVIFRILNVINQIINRFGCCKICKRFARTLIGWESKGQQKSP